MVVKKKIKNDYIKWNFKRNSFIHCEFTLFCAIFIVFITAWSFAFYEFGHTEGWVTNCFLKEIYKNYLKMFFPIKNKIPMKK